MASGLRPQSKAGLRAAAEVPLVPLRGEAKSEPRSPAKEPLEPLRGEAKAGLRPAAKEPLRGSAKVPRSGSANPGCGYWRRIAGRIV